MPASVIGSQLSWGAYLGAAAALILVLSQPLGGVEASSRAGSELRSALGIRSVLDSLRPGLSVNFSFSPGSASPLVLSGNLLSFQAGNRTVSVRCSIDLPSMTLLPSHSYSAALVDGTVKVVPLG